MRIRDLRYLPSYLPTLGTSEVWNARWNITVQPGQEKQHGLAASGSSSVCGHRRRSLHLPRRGREPGTILDVRRHHPIARVRGERGETGVVLLYDLRVNLKYADPVLPRTLL